MTPGQPPRPATPRVVKRTRFGWKRTLLAGTLAMLLLCAAAWFVPRHGIETQQVVRSGQVRSVLGTSVKAGPTGYVFTGADGWDAFADLPSGEMIGVSGYQYRNGFQRRILAALMHPSRNSIAWDDPQHWTPPRDKAWGLPGGADLVGTMCGSGTCGRWLIWWPYRDSVFIVDYRPLDAVGTADAVAAMSPLLKGVREALAS
jgi:hypothetical protein